MEADAVRVEVRNRLDLDAVVAVSALVDAVTAADGVRPLSEHVMLHLHHGGAPADRNVLLYAADGALAAYGHLDGSHDVGGAAAELAVHPDHRGVGSGRTLVQALVDCAPGGRLRLWAHGEGSAAAGLARSMGFERMRALWLMRRSLTAQLPEPELPVGVTVRPFAPGLDDDRWVELNARAFAGHPEQGSWSIDDLHQRRSAPWFDAEGFFVAERGDRLVGSHWTKVHGGIDPDSGDARGTVHPHAPEGEVYVLGVDPGERGNGLGRALALVGLRHLQARGLAQAMLYVEADNAPAIRLYTALGFTHSDTDAMFRR